MNFAGNFLLKVAQSPGCVRGLIRLHLSYCTMRTMFWLKELNFHFNQFCRGVFKLIQVPPFKISIQIQNISFFTCVPGRDALWKHSIVKCSYHHAFDF